MSEPALPSDYSRIKRVTSFQELANTPWADGVNALCWPRVLAGDFAEVVALLGMSEEPIVTLDEARLRALQSLGEAGKAAVVVMLGDLRLLRDLGREPVLNCINGYPRDEQPGPVATDVFSWHVDSAPIEADTWLCTYHGAASEGLRHDEAWRKVDVPAIRAALLQHYGGSDDAGFREFLSENCYDLHYGAVPGAQPYTFGLFNLWRIAVDWPGSPVPPCIHRAPETNGPRLLLIS